MAETLGASWGSAKVLTNQIIAGSVAGIFAESGSAFALICI